MNRCLSLLTMLWLATATAAATKATERTFSAFDGRIYFKVTTTGEVKALPVHQPEPLVAALHQIRIDGRRTLVAYGDEASKDRLRTMLRYGYPFAEPSIQTSRGDLMSLTEVAVRTFDSTLIREIVGAQGLSAFCAVNVARILKEEMKIHEYLVSTIGARAVHRLDQNARLSERRFEILTTFRSELNLTEYRHLRLIDDFAFATRNEALSRWLKSPNCTPTLSTGTWGYY